MIKDSCIFSFNFIMHGIWPLTQFFPFCYTQTEFRLLRNQYWNVAVIYILCVTHIMIVVIDFIYLGSGRNLILKYSHINGYDDRWLLVLSYMLCLGILDTGYNLFMILLSPSVCFGSETTDDLIMLSYISLIVALEIETMSTILLIFSFVLYIRKYLFMFTYIYALYVYIICIKYCMYFYI